MKVYLPRAGIVLAAASIIESAAGDPILLRGLQHTYHGHAGHSLRVLSTADAVKTDIIPSTAPSIHPSVEKLSSSSSVPTALSESILDPSDKALSMSAATASDSATVSNSSTIHDNNSQLEEEHESGIFGMSLFQTCAAVILVAMIVGLFGHYGMKLLPYNRRNRLREDNARARNDIQSEDSLASFRPHPHTSVLTVGV